MGPSSSSWSSSDRSSGPHATSIFRAFASPLDAVYIYISESVFISLFIAREGDIVQASSRDVSVLASSPNDKSPATSPNDKNPATSQNVPPSPSLFLQLAGLGYAFYVSNMIF